MRTTVGDCGHVGFDSGNVQNNRPEINYTWPVNQLFLAALKRNGFNAVTTRTGTERLQALQTVGQDLANRAHIANSVRADLFVSWHNDSFKDPQVNGVATWVHPSAKGTETEVIAQKIVNAICAATGQQNRGVRFADYQVLHDTNMAAVLIEGGFNSNPRESAFMAEHNFRKLQAEAAARAIVEHYGGAYVMEKPQCDYAGHWAEKAIGNVIQSGNEKFPALMSEYEPGTFKPDQPITRAEVATILNRLIERGVIK